MTEMSYGSWGGDPGHSGAKPMMHLQGGMASPHTQQPMTSENDMNRRGSNDSPFKGWESTVIGSGMSGGDKLNPANPIHH